MTFKTTLLKAGKTATGIEIPPAVVESFGMGKKPPIVVTINGYSYRNTVAVMGGVYMVGVSAEHRKGAGIEGGQEIEVTIEVDTQPREVDVPADLQAALQENTAAQSHFDKISYSKKRAIVLQIEEAKTAETRTKRIVKAIQNLAEGKV